jgi:hypothetical protein
MTMHLHSTGHVCLPDGGVVRLDVDYTGRYVASHYLPDHTLHRHVRGSSLEDMLALVNLWADAFDRCACHPTTRRAS